MIPPTWQDQTLNVFKIAATPPAQAASFVISRAADKADRSLQAYVQIQLEQSKQQMEHFVLKREDYFQGKGTNAALIEYTWSLEGRALYLRQAFYESGDQVLICTLTTVLPDKDHYESEWREAMSSLVLVSTFSDSRVSDLPSRREGDHQ